MQSFAIRLLAIACSAVSLSACSQEPGSDTNQSVHSCEFATGEDIAKTLDQEGIAVEESVAYESSDKKTTTDCQWRFTDENDQEVFVNFRKQERTEKIKNPVYFSQRLEQFATDGFKIGNKTVEFSKQNLEGIDGGVLSHVYGNRYTKTLTYCWHDDEQRWKTLTLSRTMNEAGELNEPSEAEINQLITQLFQ